MFYLLEIKEYKKNKKKLECNTKGRKKKKEEIGPL